MNIYDIAELAGVSIATVSRVVNDSPKVSEKTKAKVRAVMEEQNYTPNVFARGLGLNSMHTVGIVCPDVSDTYMANAVAYLEKYLRKYGYDCILSCSGYKYEDKVNAVQQILQKRIDALILVGSNYAGDGGNLDMDYLSQAAGEVPVFLMNGYIRCPGVYCVLSDGYQIVYDMVSEELEVFEQNKILKVRDTLLKRKQEDFDAVLATDDGLAVGALKYVRMMGRSVPQDVEIIGFNDSELAVCCDPELSSVDSRGELLCRTIVESMRQLLAGHSIRHKKVVPCRLVKRNTTN